MLFGNDRSQLRSFYIEVWRKFNAGQDMEPLEQVVLQVIQQHPEYHALLADPDLALERDYLPEAGETNPFLHMGMHIAIHEQLASQRPPGIGDIYRQLCRRYGDAHEAEHRMMECLAEMIWESQRNQINPDESIYLQKLARLART